MLNACKVVPAVLLALVLCGCADSSAPLPPPPKEAHKPLTTNYVYKNILPYNAGIARALKTGALIRMEKNTLPKESFEHYQKMADRMGLHPLPALYLDNLDEKPAPQAEARFTREGRMYISINKSALDKWSPKQLEAVLGHELVHLKEHHVTAANLALAYNHPELSITHEMQADRIGAGPLGSCDPQSLKEAIQIVAQIDMNDYFKKNPYSTTEAYNQLVGTHHPAWPVRKAQLDALETNAPAACNVR